MRIVAVMLTALALCLSGCGGNPTKDAQKCADAFMKKFEIADMQGMYEMLSDSSKAMMPYDQFRAAHVTVLDRLGNIIEWKSKGCFPVPDSGKSIYLINYECTFGKYRGIAQFKARKEGKRWAIVGYNYTSEGLRDQ